MKQPAVNTSKRSRREPWRLPNIALEPTPNSLRSYLAPAAGHGSLRAFGGPRGGGAAGGHTHERGGVGGAGSVAPRPGVGGGRAPWDRAPVSKAPHPTLHRTTHWSGRATA
jgi:hypothetical protein